MRGGAAGKHRCPLPDGAPFPLTRRCASAIGIMHAPSPPIIPTDMLLLAYRSGIFPMSDDRDDPEVFWVEPRHRAILPLDGFRCSRSLAKIIRQDRFRITCNRAFEQVVNECAQPRPDHPGSWISARIEASYRALHMAGHAHSIECWQDIDGSEQLVGGLYGVGFDRVFCGESMFSRVPNASKVALAWLVASLNRAGAQVLDCQFMTDHLASLGAVEMPQARYLEMIEAVRAGPPADLPAGYASLFSGSSAESSASSSPSSPSSPGKLIAQSLTQTS